MPEIKVDPEFSWVLGYRKWSVGRWGYAQASIQNKTRALHRFLWALANKCDYAQVPTLDHINRDKLDNRLSNLRPASECLNRQNRSDRGPNVFTRSRDKSLRYEAVFGFRGKRIYLGRHASKENAVAAYTAVKTLLCIVEDALSA
jgi:hypothetical protein